MDRKESLRKQISDMLAVEEHILEAIERQRDDDRIKDRVEVNKLLIEIERVLNKHVQALRSLADKYGAKTESAAKDAVTKLLGVAAGIYDRVRGKHPISRDLRDNYVALSLAAMSYTAFHTYGLTVKEERVATLAREHLGEITPLMIEISKLLPSLVAQEVSEESDFPTEMNIVNEAVSNTQKAWSREATEGVGTS